MKRFKNRRTTSTAAILCMAALLFAVLLAGCSVQKETEASGDQQQETWSEEMEIAQLFQRSRMIQILSEMRIIRRIQAISGIRKTRRIRLQL